MNSKFALRVSSSLVISLVIVLFLISCSSQPSVPIVTPASGAYSTDLSSEASPEYGLIFIVEQDNPSQIAGYMVFCGSGGGLSMPRLEGLSGKNVEISENKFTIDNENVLIQGQITATNKMEGTIEAKSQDALNCTIPQNAQWIAQCGLPTGLSFLTIQGKSFSEDALEGSCQ